VIHAHDSSHANLVQTCQRKRLPLVAITASALDVLSNSYRALLLSAALFGGFKSRRPIKASDQLQSRNWSDSLREFSQRALAALSV
jgi:hypothetical protein